MKNVVRLLYGSMSEALRSVLPICAIVLLLSVSLSPLMPGVMVMFLFGALLIIFGMSIFTLGATMSMQPIGEGVGHSIARSKNIFVPILVTFALGFLITIAEPDLTVLAEKVPQIDSMSLILLVGLGVGGFLVVAMLKTRYKLQLSKILVPLYVLVLIFACIIQYLNPEFLPTAFDSGGVTTGPITVPFIMALGAGMAAVRTDKHSGEDSFGLVALCSIGPIIAVMILSIMQGNSTGAEGELAGTVEDAASAFAPSYETMSTRDAFLSFIGFENGVFSHDAGIIRYVKEVAIAFSPLVGVFVVYQLITRRFKKNEVIRICIGLVYTYIGLVLFLTGANVGFMPAGELLGSTIAESSYAWVLVPIGMALGYFVVSAEPAVHTLKKQVEEVTNGAISQRSIGIALSVGVAVSVGISMLRILLHIPILPILIVGYIIPLVITFFVPPIYTGIAFDSGGVASGPMATTFILPLAIGACQGMGGDAATVMTDAFGIVAMIAMTPLITIQVLGLIGKTRQDRRLKQIHSEIEQIDDGIVYYD
ncbi:MAG: DUF1538 domain-containing protein [Clostridia bacterium]|nr:DUF1538 domain-containing protein [Clostridia bacterium]